MAAAYDGFSRQYQKSRELPFRTYVEEYLFLEMLGNPTGLAALDLACGEGHYARLLRRRGAERVVGADISGAMIALGREQEARAPLGIEYVQKGVEELGVVGSFDVVTAAYLLHYSPTREHLEAMCRTIAANLRPGGWLVTINGNYGPGVPADTSKYGWRPSDTTAIEEGKAFRLTCLLGPDAFEIENYYYSHDTYEEVLLAAGFRLVQWHPPVVSPEGLRTFEPGYWREFLEKAPIIGIACQR